MWFTRKWPYDFQLSSSIYNVRVLHKVHPANYLSAPPRAGCVHRTVALALTYEKRDGESESEALSFLAHHSFPFPHLTF